MSENKTKKNSKSTGCTILLQDKEQRITAYTAFMVRKQQMHELSVDGNYWTDTRAKLEALLK